MRDPENLDGKTSYLNIVPHFEEKPDWIEAKLEPSLRQFIHRLSALALATGKGAILVGGGAFLSLILLETTGGTLHLTPQAWDQGVLWQIDLIAAIGGGLAGGVIGSLRELSYPTQDWEM